MDRSSSALGSVIGGLVIFGILAAGIIGLGVGVKSAWEAPEVIAAQAQQERARAAILEAQAAAEWQKAEQEKTQTWRATVDAQSWAATAPTRTRALEIVFYGGAVVLVVVAFGGAVVGLFTMWQRAGVIYPAKDGRWPILLERSRDGLTVIDLSRSLSPAISLAGGDIYSPELAAPDLQLQVTTQAQQSAIMTGLADRRAGDQVVERLNNAVQNLPEFSGNGAPRAGEAERGLRLVYVKRPNGGSEASRDLQDIREFLERGSQIGFARTNWVNHNFRSGHRCTRARYDDLIAKCKGANVLGEQGQTHVLAVSLNEALDAFGVGDKDINPQEQEAEA